MLVKNCFCFQEKEGAKEDDKPKFFTPAFLKLGQDAEKAQLETAKAQKAAEAAAAILRKRNLDGLGNEIKVKFRKIIKLNLQILARNIYYNNLTRKAM